MYIITYRRDRQKAIERLAELKMTYDELILVSTFKEKAVVIQANGIRTYFDDQDEILKDIGPEVDVFKIRNGGNFDYDRKLWLFSEKTGRML